MKISCVTASYIADLVGYPGAVDWGAAGRKIIESPMLETIEGMVRRLAPAKLDGIELYYPHISPTKLTPVLASEIRRRLSAAGMSCAACAGGVPDPAKDPYGAEEQFQTARLIDTRLIAGHVHVERLAPLTRLCRKYGVRLGYENGAEPDVAAILAAIQGGNKWIGANLDTGNMAAQGGDPVGAVRELGATLIHVHLKDVPSVGSHECVAMGKGIVDIAGVLRELKRLDYDGWLSIEIETGDHDPTDEILESADTVRRLLGN
ncbi:MAG: sugar phosphate isomerase/epimerase [Anaerolineales bacterium]|nr:sugar phosphate isomerase/epimerase [Anaerolineales bacterium]